MTEILPGVHMVDGVNPSPDFTTNILLLKDAKGGSWTLLDTGLPVGRSPKNAVEAIEHYGKEHGIPFSSIQHILLTHLHADHTGNLKALAERTHAKTYAHWIEASFIAGDPAYKGPGMPPPDRFEVTERLRDGAELDLFDGLVALSTPGHTPGHMAYYCPSRKILFAGDSIFGEKDGVVVSAKEYTFSQSLAVISLRRLADLEVESAIMYHGSPVLKGGKAQLRNAARKGYGSEPTN